LQDEDWIDDIYYIARYNETSTYTIVKFCKFYDIDYVCLMNTDDTRLKIIDLINYIWKNKLCCLDDEKLESKKLYISNDEKLVTGLYFICL
jgi:hypothetical protein